MGTRKSTKEPVASFGWEQVLGWRLRRQWLDRRASGDEVLQVASDIRGLHAQVLSSAELTLWARIDGLKAGELGRLLNFRVSRDKRQDEFDLFERGSGF